MTSKNSRLMGSSSTMSISASELHAPPSGGYFIPSPFILTQILWAVNRGDADVEHAAPCRRIPPAIRRAALNGEENPGQPVPPPGIGCQRAGAHGHRPGEISFDEGGKRSKDAPVGVDDVRHAPVRGADHRARLFSTARKTAMVMCCIAQGTEKDHASLVMLTSTSAPLRDEPPAEIAEGVLEADGRGKTHAFRLEHRRDGPLLPEVRVGALQPVVDSRQGLLEGKALRERHQVELAVRVHDPVPVNEQGRVEVDPHLLPFLHPLELAVIVAHDKRDRLRGNESAQLLHQVVDLRVRPVAGVPVDGRHE